MKKYYVVSDIHGYYDEFRSALKKAGFKVKDPDDILIVCGDIFDRGTQPLQLYKWLRKLPKNRRILIRGNHEYLLKELVKRGYPESHDRHNRTIDTLYQLQGYQSEGDFVHCRYREQSVRHIEYGTPEYANFSTKWNNKEKAIFDNPTINSILKWIDSDDWVNYYELGKFIFVHSFIPIETHINIEKSRWSGVIIKDSPDSYDPNWRNASQDRWEDATWGCPWKYFKEGLFDTEILNGKVLVCGHWHASDFWNNLQYSEQKNKWLDIKAGNPIFYSYDFPNIIALDTCTVLTHGVNVLVVDQTQKVSLYNHNEEGKHVIEKREYTE